MTTINKPVNSVYKQTVQSIPRDPEYRSIPVPAAGRSPDSRFLRAAAFPAFASGLPFWGTGRALSAYSDEIVQAFHLFPYYPPAPQRMERHRLLYSIATYAVILSRRKAECNLFWDGILKACAACRLFSFAIDNKKPFRFRKGFWSLRPDSNRRPAHYECAALPTEPRKHIS
jgi:hypothetical protein